MNFDFGVEEQQFIVDVRQFIAEQACHDDADDVMNPNRESDSILSDTPARKRFNKAMAQRGYMGMSWPEAYGGKAMPGIYEYLLNEELSRVGAPLIGKGVGCVGQTLIRHGSEKLKAEFLPQILKAEVEFALGYTEPSAGSDLASLKLKAERSGNGWLLNGQKMFTTSAHFADWYWLAARTDPQAKKHKGISLFLLPMNHPGITITPIETLGEHVTNQVFIDDVWVSDDYLVGECNNGWRYICEALDYERFTFYTFSPLEEKFNKLMQLIKNTDRDGVKLAEDPCIRRDMARLATELETAKMLQRRVIYVASKGEVPSIEAAECKLYSTELHQRLSQAAMNFLGEQGLLHKDDADAPMGGKWEWSYRATPLDTIGAGTTEIQKNIIARKKLELPLEY
ncbi:acyl-CoA dehydrogenase family protein [Dasania marina]|uniref:acyl-CoA dehydrogenase family protein n=1 Tax=Dasania marina TaxID=471499 RepID=UPI000367CA68|nr:acyl-CoA dehydrogenase family protein [Dasania marina]